MYRSLKNQLTVKSTSIIFITFFLVVALLIPKENNTAPLPELLAVAQEQHPQIPSDKVDGLHQLTQDLSQQLTRPLTRPMVQQLVPQLAAAPAGWFMPQNDFLDDIHFGEIIGEEIEENTRESIAAIDEATARSRILAWLKTNWLVYALDDVDLLPAGLHELVQTQQSLFQHPSRQVRIGLPAAEHQPPLGQAYTCFKGNLANSNVVLFTQSLGQNLNELITVQVVGAYPRVDGKKYSDIQLNEQYAKALFKRQARAIESAVALTF